MSKNKKLLRNLAFICVVLYGFYYFGGWYLSREECVEDSARGLYANTFEEIMVLENGRYSSSVLANLDEMTISLMGAQRIGPFYRPGSGHSGIQLDKYEKNFQIISSYNEDIGMCLVIYRINKDIDHIIVVFKNGETVILDDWTKDFSGCLINTNEWLRGTYYSYDSNHQLIEERNY